MGELHHIGYRFYTHRVDPKDWVYEEYLAEVDALESNARAQGSSIVYHRHTAQGFAEARARQVWGLPEPAPRPSTTGLERLRAVMLKITRMSVLDLLEVRRVQLLLQTADDPGPPRVQVRKR